MPVGTLVNHHSHYQNLVHILKFAELLCLGDGQMDQQKAKNAQKRESFVENLFDQD